MTIFEWISIILSIIAILIPIVQWLWKKFVQKPKVKYYPNGKAILFFNQSGSYVRIDGVLEAINQPVSIKKLELAIVRKSDDRKLNLSWSTFISPITQSIVGAVSQTTEKAHPFRIEADSIACAFTEFADEYNSAWKNIILNTKELFNSIPDVKGAHQNYQDARAAYMNSDLYQTAKLNISKEFLWEISKYDLILTVLYLNKKMTFKYQIEVDENDKQLLSQNIDESLLYPLKDAYEVSRTFNTIEKELRDI